MWNGQDGRLFIILTAGGGESGDDKFAWSMSGIDSELDWNFYVVYTSNTSLRKKEL